MEKIVREKITDNQSKGQHVQAVCDHCQRETSQHVLTSVTRDSEDVYDENCSVSSHDVYQIIQCGGCKAVSFRETTYFSEDDYGDGHDPTKINLYPERTLAKKSFIDTIEFPQNVSWIYNETISSFNNDNLILCAGGLRCIVETTCNDLGVKGFTFFSERKNKEILNDSLEGKIKGLAQAHHLTEATAHILQAFRFMGNDALHEIKIPLQKDLHTAIEIIEHFLQHIYDLPAKAKTLTKKNS